jgi:hypothetical protein
MFYYEMRTFRSHLVCYDKRVSKVVAITNLKFPAKM